MRWIALLLMSCPAMADDSLLRLVESSIACRERVKQLEARVAELERRGGDPAHLRGEDATLLPEHEAPAPQRTRPPSVGRETNRDAAPGVAPKPGAATPTTAPPAASTAVCQCRGSNEAVCFCLRAGLKCHCSREVGSVWRIEGGRAVSKTGAKANPNQAAFSAEWDRRVNARQTAQAAPEPPQDAKADERPVLHAYSTSWCATCRVWKNILDNPDLPFRVVWHEGDLPAGVEKVPAFKIRKGDGWVYWWGIGSVDRLVKLWESGR